MKRLLFYVIILILAVWLGLTLESDPGYILLVYKQWTAETSLWFGILLLIVVFFILYQVLKFLRLVIKSRGHIVRWHRQKRFIKAHTVTGAGLLALEEGAWEEAENLLLDGAKSSSIPVVNYINAAKAAQEQHHYAKRDQLLQHAFEAAQRFEKMAVQLTQASLHIDHQQFAEAEILLNALQENNPRHRYILKLLKKLYLATHNWPKLAALLPVLKKRRVFDDGEYEQLAIKVYRKLFSQQYIDFEQLQNHWKTMSKNLRKNPVMVDCYTKQLIRLHHDTEAQDMISDLMKKDYYPELVKNYGCLHLANMQKPLHQAELWLKKYGERMELLTALGNLAYKKGDTLEAKNYIERALSLGENFSAYKILANIYEQLGNDKNSFIYLQKAIALMEE